MIHPEQSAIPLVNRPVLPSSDGLWAITSYFNPMSYRRKLSNYRLFRKYLNVPLVAVELGYGEAFDLGEQDADILVQLRGGDVLWQKERLLNVALQALPDSCRKVVWVDCDIIFGSDDWPERLSRLLDRFMMVQPFNHVYYMPRDWEPEEISTERAELTRVAAAFVIGTGTPAATCLSLAHESRHGVPAMSHAWAARRQLVDQRGFYDASIIGGGSRAMTSASYGCFDEAISLHYMNDSQKQRYMAWASPHYQAVRGAAAFLDGNLFHLWHGDMRHRRTRERHKQLECFQFDPFEDIVIDASGCWRWNTDKRQLHQYVRDYFASRNEDG